MEALSTLTIGKNVMRVRVQVAQVRLVAVGATEQAGYTIATEDDVRNTGSLKNSASFLPSSRHDEIIRAWL
jgi:hypothetical protein